MVIAVCDNSFIADECGGASYVAFSPVLIGCSYPKLLKRPRLHDTDFRFNGDRRDTSGTIFAPRHPLKDPLAKQFRILCLRCCSLATSVGCSANGLGVNQGIYNCTRKYPSSATFLYDGVKVSLGIKSKDA